MVFQHQCALKHYFLQEVHDIVAENHLLGGLVCLKTYGIGQIISRQLQADENMLIFPEAGTTGAASLSERVLPTQCASAAPDGPLFKLIKSAIGYVAQMVKQEEPRSQHFRTGMSTG